MRFLETNQLAGLNFFYCYEEFVHTYVMYLCREATLGVQSDNLVNLLGYAIIIGYNIHVHVHVHIQHVLCVLALHMVIC